jgi:ribosome biogenesis GTPase
MTDGLIIKGIGGFYYVETADGVYECKARGIFRKKHITPLVGDRVHISVNENAENTVDEILERKNYLVRPPLANIDILFILASIVEPAINTTVIDRLTAIAEYKQIEPVILLTKTDLCGAFEEYLNTYTLAGYRVIVCDSFTGEGLDEIKSLISGNICAFTGNSGVGKSTLLNALDDRLTLETGEISKKLGRGRHTTRHCELFSLAGGYVADTPGFSALDIERCERILKQDLPYCFREFAPYLENCRFMTSCSHINDKGCAVAQAVKDGKIAFSRHESYKIMYNEVKDINEWEMK